MQWEPRSKRDKHEDSDIEDDINVEKVIEKTDKQAEAYEHSLQQSRNFSFIDE